MQDVEYIVARDTDEKQYNMELQQRVYVHVRLETIMGFEMDQIDSTPIL